MRRARRASSFISLHKKVFESCDLNQSVNNKINGRSSNCDKGRNSQSFTVNHWLWVVWQKAGWMALNILHKDRAHQLEPCPFSLLSPPTTNPRRRSIKRARVISTVLLVWLNAFCSRQSRSALWFGILCIFPPREFTIFRTEGMITWFVEPQAPDITTTTILTAPSKGCLPSPQCP